MSASENSNTNFIRFILIVLIAGLVTGGILMIVQSNKIYEQSYNQSEAIAKKIIDTAYKAPIALPAPNYSSVKEGYGQALLYFTLAIAALLVALLLPRLQTFSISPTGGISVTLKDVQEKVEELIKQTNTIQASSAGEGGKIKTSSAEREFKTEIAEENNDDPQKGKWGGLAETNGRRLSASVEESKEKGFYKVKLIVESTDTKRPLKGLVKFHLHNTFFNPDPVIAVQDGTAVLNLAKVYGAFTVGAEAEGGQTVLELDLSENKTYPLKFREG